MVFASLARDRAQYQDRDRAARSLFTVPARSCKKNIFLKTLMYVIKICHYEKLPCIVTMTSGTPQNILHSARIVFLVGGAGVTKSKPLL